MMLCAVRFGMHPDQPPPDQAQPAEAKASHDQDRHRRPDYMPIIITPTGPVPMHIVTIPITRDRAAGGASVRIKVVCMFEKAAVPSPPTSNNTNAIEYHGDRAIVA